ncbi:uncharacterized protein LOC134698888 [Mytilus trossulus]|uniref:uncharacterized protein LOC134698888 n=1 Tax=Mytilus trossulus TaxID=6551 RepID=UPI003006574F
MLSWIKPFMQREEQRSLSRNSDQEEDGFLVVGQTKSEKTTIVASEFNSNIDRPPNYMEVDNQALPDYSAALSREVTPNNRQCTSDVYQQSGDNTNNDYSANALQDVPFSVNPKLQLMWGVGHMGMPNQRCYDPSKYDYDFTLEYSILHSSF